MTTEKVLLALQIISVQVEKRLVDFDDRLARID
jgi:hypothetical protein